ncbi:Gfo/Idh/MocA family oxidoreductase [Lichenihabitans sp. Uapishka_5]|uniref:Gfo/Idh/MocA family protein n=1 Tax=Lichenihabitans sp. Uapishka_5 TaxID=3037302 RepID=UPI0029E7E8CB|nr:Gfo/Idh/MocA family oxidoreductase [Lichenihabitans sp. Uapishka_5]MDX7953612.1 Gfo/Idh/MocA family oxidoreductase [Lichenihabitans sp. Uapishka_5]
MTIEASAARLGGGRIRLGMVGGGEGAFIGAVHRIAARLDDRFTLVAGALSSTAEKAQRSGAALGLDPERVYDDFATMARDEAARPDGIQVVAIVTPNHMHYPAAKAFLDAGIHVICDKPLTATFDEAKALAAAVRASGRLFVLTHNYTGYPMIRQAREMIAAGALGPLRYVQSEYIQDWLTEAAEATGSKQAEWRTDPGRSGAGGAIGDIGTHAFNMLSFVTGLRLESVLADLTSFVPGRRLDDSVEVLLRFEGGAKGMLWASQIAVGHENSQSLRVYGTKGGLEWHQEQPNELWFTRFGEPKQLLTRNGAGAGPANRRVSRVPPGHPEGYLEGFATLYSEAAAAIEAASSNQAVDPAVTYPTIEDGLAGMTFIAACVQSSAEGGRWTTVEQV